MKSLIKELKSYFAEKLVFFALCLNPETVIDLTVPSKIKDYSKPIEVKSNPKTEIERVIEFIKIQMFVRKWKILKENPESNFIQLIRTIEGVPVKMSIYYTKKSKMTDLNLTVSTSLDHPKRGKTQLHRKGVGKKIFLALLENPRTHTGSGYYKKPKKS